MPDDDPRLSPWWISAEDLVYSGDSRPVIGSLLKYAILAPSSHNTQPWKFRVGENEIHLIADTTRWLPVADPDKRELYISAGCALENLLIAASYFGYGHRVEYLPDPANEDLVAIVGFDSTPRPVHFRSMRLFGAIADRRTSHHLFEDRALPSDQLRLLHSCTSGDGIEIIFFVGEEEKRAIETLIVRSDAIHFADPAFRRELAHWIGEGAFGTPWLFAKIAQLAVAYLDLGKSVAKHDAAALMSAPVIGVIAARDDDRVTQVKVGQTFERIYLEATLNGISIQPMSQPVEIPELRAELANLLPMEGMLPHQPFRIGYAEPERSHTPRRPLEEMLL